MSRRPALLLLLGALAVLAAADWRAMLSPGVLGRAHDPFAGDCDRCHLPFAGVPDGKCLDCHEGLAARIAAGEGWHAGQPGACISCHPDHRGLDASLTTPEAMATFDHAGTGFALGGRHGALACEDCHTAPIGQMPTTCGTCHEDPHGSALGPDCVACHGDAGWRVGLKALADHATAMDGGHAGKTCEDCHTHGRALEPSVPCATCHLEAHGGTAASCAQCHEVSGFTPARFDHGPCTCAFPGKHQTVGCLACHADFDFTDTPTLCSGCHAKDRPHDDLGECSRCHSALSWTDDRFDHDSSKFPLRGAHLSVSCQQCHTTAGQFRGAPTACAGCHAEAGEAAHGDFGACEACHAVEAFAPSTFHHAPVGFALTGRHAALPCRECHDQKVKGYPE